jgi:signal transduction histidine kinase/DNA-binding response OmpR family regulator
MSRIPVKQVKFRQLFWKTFPYLIYCVAAFSLMVFVGFFALGSVLRKQLLERSLESLDTAEANIRKGFESAELVLDFTCYGIQTFLEQDSPEGEIRGYIKGANSWMSQYSGSSILKFNGIYGYIRGEFFDREGVSRGKVARGKSYNSDERLTEGPRSRDQISYSAPYTDSRTGELIVTLSRNILGPSASMSVLSLDVEISSLAAYVNSLSLAKGGYGILLNQLLMFMTHPNPCFRGRQLQSFGGDYIRMSQMLLNSGEIRELNISNYQDKEMIWFGRRLFNNWYIILGTPSVSYYQDLFRAAIYLSSLAVILVSILSFFILRISASRMHADDMSQYKTNFLARMSHDIRTPMNAIIGMSELALRKDTALEMSEYLGSIKQAGYNLLSIISDILDISRIEAGSLTIANNFYTLSSVINDVINVLRVQLSEKQLIFSVHVDGGIPNNLLGDKIRIRQIMLNLLSNAVKYTHEGFIKLSIHSEPGLSPLSIKLIFSVADSGIGIKKEDMPELFDDFVRLDQEHNQGIEGTGLGLAICRNLCRLMRGEITAESEYGKGSVFTVTLPQVLADKETLAVVENPGEKRVLCYEREPVSAESIRATLENLGVGVTMVRDDDEFFRELAEGDYQFAFISCSLVEATNQFIQEKSLITIPVALAHLGEIVAARNTPTIVMPVWAIPAANVLNYRSQIERHDKGRVRFTAPDVHILIVDDIITNQKVIEGFLLLYKIRIDAAGGGMEAVTKVKQNRYDLVFMDHMMPGMDGIEAVAAIRAMEGDYFRTLPIIALTANAVAGMRDTFLEKGFNDFLAKPIEITKLDELMLKWIPKKKQIPIGRSMNIAAPGERQPPDVSADPFVSVVPLVWEIFPEDKVVPGLDLPAALRRYGGGDAYLRVLRIYAAETAQLLEKIRNVTPETLGDYAIIVHGIKGSSNGICAAEVGQLALLLETAAKGGNFDFVAAHNGPFLKTTEELLGNIRGFLERLTPASEGDKAWAEIPDPALLQTFLEACKVYNTTEMEKTLDLLETVNYHRDGDMVFWLREQLDSLEYDVIQEQLEKYLENGSLPADIKPD